MPPRISIAELVQIRADAYDDTILPADDTFIDAEDEITDVYVYNIDFITNGGTISNDVFTNPTFEYEVCFVAGTQVLMADGSTKSIETIEPGDQVLAAHHLNPEEKPTSAKVLTFFDNGLKSVVKLIFENPKTGETQEIVCTPEHPFYVIDKGWIRSQDLQQGNLCLSATGEKIAFLSRENLSEKQRVYNFEVEEKHAYFVGVNIEISTLVHNSCWDAIRVAGAGVGGFFTGLGQGVVNIANGVIKTGSELGRQAIDTGAGVITAGSMLFSDDPIVFDPWSNSLNAFDQRNVSVGGYYGNFAANTLTVGVYSEVQAGVQLWNGDISVNEASEIFGSTGVLQYLSARAIKNPVQKQSAKTFVDQMSPTEAARYQKYWHDAKLKQYPGVSSWAREQVSNNGNYKEVLKTA